MVIASSIQPFSPAWADALPVLCIPPLTITDGQPILTPITIDKAEKLAGVKLVIHYDSTQMTYKTAEKGDAAASFMYVVNDKKPGELIIVMAGAKGISGKDISLITLKFEVVVSEKTDSSSQTDSRIKIIEAELMNEKLEYIKFEIRGNP